MQTKHLDLGCGGNPRNPFEANDIYALDIVERCDISKKDVSFVIANLALEDIPFPDNFFDSVSAYDFIEHIPRMICIDRTTALPFIKLMSEIYRVLKPNGQFYAVTPFFPMESAFMDPTHVNFISKNTHKYFVSPYLWAKMYGFSGQFESLDVRKVNFDLLVNKQGLLKSLIYRIVSVINPRSKQHILWHFSAIKPV